MIVLNLAILLLAALKTVLSASISGIGAASHEAPLSGLPRHSDIDDPYRDFFTTDTPDTVNFTSAYNSPNFNVAWYHAGKFEAGKGWHKGSDRNISYTGTYESNGYSFIGVTGWTRVCRCSCPVHWRYIPIYKTLEPFGRIFYN
jgi:endo-1,4-beta-xylanase